MCLIACPSPLPAAFLVAHSVKSVPATQDSRVQSLSREDPLRRDWHPTPVFSPGESHGQRSLVGYSQWGHTSQDTTERLTLSSHLPLYQNHIHTVPSPCIFETVSQSCLRCCCSLPQIKLHSQLSHCAAFLKSTV